MTGCEAGDRQVRRRPGVFELLARLRPRSPEPRPPYDACDACLGGPYADVLVDEDRAVSEVVDRYRALAARCDRVLVVAAPSRAARVVPVDGSPVAVLVVPTDEEPETARQAAALLDGGRPGRLAGWPAPR